MRKFLFAALAFMALSFISCSDKDSGGEVPSSNYIESALVFEYELSGDVKPFVIVDADCTIAASDGRASVEKSDGKVTVSVANIKGFAKFDINIKLTVKENITIEDTKSYSLAESASFTSYRIFDDGSRIPDPLSSSSSASGSVAGKDLPTLFELKKLVKYPFAYTADGFIDNSSAEE